MKFYGFYIFQIAERRHFLRLFRIAAAGDKGFSKMTHIDRFEFYERAKKAYAIIATSETAQYANILLKKGLVLEK